MSAPFPEAPPRMCQLQRANASEIRHHFVDTKKRTLGAARNLETRRGAGRAFKRQKTAGDAASALLRPTTGQPTQMTNCLLFLGMKRRYAPRQRVGGTLPEGATVASGEPPGYIGGTLVRLRAEALPLLRLYGTISDQASVS